MNNQITFRGKTYRAEVDMRVLDQYFRAVGSEDLNGLTRGLPSDVLLLLYLSLVEGAVLDGVELDLELEDLLRLHKPEYDALLEEFEPAMRDQVSPQLSAEQPKGSKKKVKMDQP